MLPPLLTTIDRDNYQNYLDEKIERVSNLLKETLHTPASMSGYEDICALTPEVHPSTPQFYRIRAEFAVYHPDEAHIRLGMYEPGSKPRKLIFVDEFLGCTPAINHAMTLLTLYLPPFRHLKTKLFEADFLCNNKDEVVITLHYHKKLTEQWTEEATQLREALLNRGLNCSFVAHARKQVLVVGSDHVIETINTTNGEMVLKYLEGTFCQPNSYVCGSMLNFAIDCARGIRERVPQGKNDLLELYCGSGTFTVTVAPFFDKVLATEVARVPTATAFMNMALNGIENAKLVRLSAAEVTQALNREREFNRLKEKEVNLDDYNFHTLLIDPPRAGLQTDEAREFTSHYDHVIYISCGPESLAQDLVYLSRTHHIKRLAFFDQFPYTHHLESGVLLVKKDLSY